MSETTEESILPELRAEADQAQLEDMTAAIPTETLAPVPVPDTPQQNLTLLHGATDFEIEPGKRGQPWHASNGSIGITVFPSEANTDPSKRVGDTPALLFKHNSIHMPMGSAAAVPFSHRTQVLMAELNGVFFHLVERDGTVAIVVADRRLGS